MINPVSYPKRHDQGGLRVEKLAAQFDKTHEVGEGG